MEKSKLPVFQHQTQNTADQFAPYAKKSCPQKPAMPLYSKDPNIAFSSTVPEFGVLKGSSNGKPLAAAKKTAPSTRGPGYRYRMESELKDKNHILQAANANLQSSLLASQNTIKEMSEKQSTLEGELKELKQRLEKSMIILESQNIDPVSGELILAREEETTKLREETKAVTEELLKEFKLFSLTTKEQILLVQAVKEKWKESEGSRKEFLEEQNAFQNDLEQFRASLEETEKWLDL